MEFDSSAFRDARTHLRPVGLGYSYLLILPVAEYWRPSPDAF